MTTSSTGTLAGRVALVTGASRRVGIGAAIVRCLVAAGAAVLVHSWSRTTSSAATKTTK
jgi:3-oxoacyl-[acyl-carrier protein] reductase